MLGTLLMLGFVYDSPLNHPRVDAVEKQYLLSFQLKGQSSKVVIFPKKNFNKKKMTLISEN